MLFADRHTAGKALSAALQKYRDEDPLVIAVPRGGVPVAYEVARRLGAPLDVLWSRRDAALQWLDALRVRAGGATDAEVKRMLDGESEALRRRIQACWGKGNRPDIEGRTVIVVVDGVRSAAVTDAALEALRAREPARLILATPVITADASAVLSHEVDAVVAVEQLPEVESVNGCYADAAPVTDDEVVASVRGAKPN